MISGLQGCVAGRRGWMQVFSGVLAIMKEWKTGGVQKRYTRGVYRKSFQGFTINKVD